MMNKEREPINGTGNGTAEIGTPRAAVGRLSLYLRQVETLHRAGKATVSSNQLGTALEITDAQVRKDLAYFGQFGHPGIGYKVGPLRDALRSVLGTNREWRVALIGVGNLGRALLGYQGFAGRGFSICALFDRDPNVIGRQFHGMTVLPLDTMCELGPRLGIELAILAVPSESAEEVAHEAARCGINGFLNFAPVPLKLPSEYNVVSVDLGLQLEQLAFQVTKRNGHSYEPDLDNE